MVVAALTDTRTLIDQHLRRRWPLQGELHLTIYSRQPRLVPTIPQPQSSSDLPLRSMATKSARLTQLDLRASPANRARPRQLRLLLDSKVPDTATALEVPRPLRDLSYAVQKSTGLINKNTKSNSWDYLRPIGRKKYSMHSSHMALSFESKCNHRFRTTMLGSSSSRHLPTDYLIGSYGLGSRLQDIKCCSLWSALYQVGWTLPNHTMSPRLFRPSS